MKFGLSTKRKGGGTPPLDPPTASNVTLLDTLVTSLTSACRNFWVTPDKRIFACSATRVISVDASDPSNMSEVDSLLSSAFNNVLASCCVVGNYLYVVGSSVTNPYMSVIDISDPTDMVIANHVTGIELRGYTITTDGTYLYTIARGSGGALLTAIAILDLVDPVNPSLIANADAVSNSAIDGLFIRDNAEGTVANELLVSTDNEIEIWDITDKEIPVYKSTYVPPRDNVSAYYAHEETNFYFPTDRGNSVETVDISDLSLPTEIGEVSSLGRTIKAQGTLNGPLLFVESTNDLAVIDKTDPTNPTIQAEHGISISDGERMFIEGNILFTCRISIQSIDVN